MMVPSLNLKNDLYFPHIFFQISFFGLGEIRVLLKRPENPEGRITELYAELLPEPILGNSGPFKSVIMV